MAKAPTHAISPTRAEDYPGWYQQIIRAADMADNAPVRGCMVIKPWGYGIWELVQRAMDDRIKATGHDNCYFPLFIPLRFIEKEAQHVEGFAKEMAVVTHHRLAMHDGKLVPEGELEEPLIVRPTSETIIGEAFRDWIQSYRDLPVLVNQWANVVRWEMRPRIFLRTSEFLWQEGHTAHATADEAVEEMMRMLEVYREVVEDVMAIPVIPGEKSESERFPGADRTTTIEAMMQDGKALQSGTSHFLGQNFAKAANIRFQTREEGLDYVWTTSWGSSTRLIGALIMTHGDDDGLRVPPKVAPRQVMIVPIIRDPSQAGPVLDYANRIADELSAQSYAGAPVRVRVDARDLPSQDKRWEWIKKGTPIVAEVGPRDIENDGVAFVRRDRLGEKKAIVGRAEFVGGIAAQLDELHRSLFGQALAYRRQRSRDDIATYDDFREYFGGKGADAYDAERGFVRAKWCGERESEAKLADLGVSIRCLPFDQSGTEGKCVLTGKPATTDAIFAKAY
ncbi:MAG: proline--tRNA ligase [Alphaproteobacteria bacterium]